MIDLHSHLLHGLDDGAKTLEESIEMCRLAFQDGIRTIVATPHTLTGVYSNDRLTILAKVQELNAFLIRSELFTPNSEITILPGSDVHFSEGLLKDLEEGRLTTVGDGGRFLFVEFPFNGIPFRAESVLFQLLGRGTTPIITHPERNIEIASRPYRYYEMLRMGCLGQITAMSLTGEFGHKIKQVAESLLRLRLIHFIATDAHSVNGRPPILSKAVRSAAKIIGADEAIKMVTEYPHAILNGEKPNVPEPLSPK